MLTDRPHREADGWSRCTLTGRALLQLQSQHVCTQDCDIRTRIPNGLVPDIAPEYAIRGWFRDSPDGKCSGDSSFLYYQFYGDKSLIIDYYDVMKGYVTTLH